MSLDIQKFLMDSTSIHVLEHAFSYDCTSFESVPIETFDSLYELKYDHESNVSSSNHIWSFFLNVHFSKLLMMMT